MIKAESLEKGFNHDSLVLRDINLSISDGEFVSIVGPSGCGKSTLLRMIADLDKPSSGQLEIKHGDGQQASSNNQVNRAFVFQQATLLPWRTVEENIALPLELSKNSPGAQSSLIKDSLKLINLTDQDAQKFPHQLSGGMQMRVSLARALVTQPDIMLLDEPFAALDDVMRQRLNEELSNIWNEQKWTGLFVTHNVSEAVYLSQRVLVLGKTPATIIQDIQVPFDFPRSMDLRSQPEFAELTGKISLYLRDEVTASEVTA